MTRTRVFLMLSLGAFCAVIHAQTPDPCAGLDGAPLTQCRSNQQTLRLQERLEQQLREQQERQTQLDKQQREVQQQLESMRQQNESLRRQIELEAANQPARPAAKDPVNNLELKSWRKDNPWFGTDYPRTQFAMRYVEQLQREHPELAGRALLDALSAKVDEKFGARH